MSMGVSMSFRCVLNVALTAIVAAPSIACAQKPLARGEGVITEALIRRHVNVIADDSMLGRNTPSRGLEMTASYVASQFKRLGLKPGGDSNSYIQDRKSTRLNSSHGYISYAVFCLKKKKKKLTHARTLTSQRT